MHHIRNQGNTKPSKVLKDIGAELTEIATALGGAAVRVAGRDVLEVRLAGDDVLAMDEKLLDGGLTGGGGDDATFRIFPRGLAARPLVLNQYVRRPHLLCRHLPIFFAPLSFSKSGFAPSIRTLAAWLPLL